MADQFMKPSKFIPSVDSEALIRGINYQTPNPKPSYSMKKHSDVQVRQSANQSILPSISLQSGINTSTMAAMRKIP